MVAGSLQPHHAHICTLVFSKFFFVLWVMLQDVISVGTNTRSSEASIRMNNPTDREGNRKRFSLVPFFFAYSGGVMFMLDFMRHYLLVFMSEDTSLLVLNITNPFRCVGGGR